MNSFGLTGGFSHVIIKRAQRKPRTKHPLQDDLPRLYMLPVRNTEDAEPLLKKLESSGRSKYLAASMCHVFRKEIRGYMTRSFAVHPYRDKPIQHSQVMRPSLPKTVLNTIGDTSHEFRILISSHDNSLNDGNYHEVLFMFESNYSFANIE